MDSLVDEFVVPGDVIGKIGDLKVRVGPGLLQTKDTILATKAGVLRYSKFHRFYWIENEQKRYVPQVEDMVIGTIIEKHAESFKVDIGSSCSALLSAYSFEGATKSNKPLLNVGNLIYCRVTVANRDMEPEVVCLSQKQKAEGFGQLIGGYMLNCSLGLSHYLLSEDCYILQVLGKHIPYEIAVGVNGRVWINSGSNHNTIVVSNTIYNSQFIQDDQIEPFILKSLSTNETYTVKVKTINSNSCKGFEGFSKHYPSGLTGVMQPQEFEQVINRINMISKTRYPKTISIPLLIIFLGIILFIIGIVKFDTSVISSGFTFTLAGFIIMVVMVCFFRRKVKNNMQPALLEANNYFAERRITFTFREKTGKPKVVKQGNTDKVVRKSKQYLEIRFPAPGSSGGVLGFIQSILPSGTPAPSSNGPSFNYQPNQVNVGGVGFAPPPVNVAPTMNNGNLEFNLSAPSVAPNFNISIDAVTALKVTGAAAKGAYDGYSTFV
ncbi:hypothetical protein RB653_002905 [Dictyostelium firmibasis]|uniref:Ribosomal RNA-processing protein 40 n=1 Tax=Dictyostelium firmibasis TaxID=79012 RepID=A0AAN7YW04_9MYCE